VGVTFRILNNKKGEEGGLEGKRKCSRIAITIEKKTARPRGVGCAACSEREGTRYASCIVGKKGDIGCVESGKRGEVVIFTLSCALEKNKRCRLELEYSEKEDSCLRPIGGGKKEGRKLWIPTMRGVKNCDRVAYVLRLGEEAEVALRKRKGRGLSPSSASSGGK